MLQQVSIITCRFMDASGNGWVSDAIRCIEYCISKGAHVMSNSWGGVEYSASLQVQLAEKSLHCYHVHHLCWELPSLQCRHCSNI